LYLIFLGLPGAGKGTQAALLAEKTGIAHITSGGIFRENISKETELGRKVKPYVEKGLLVPDELTISMLLDRIGREDARRGFVLDGFPRNVDQAKALDEALSRQGKAIDTALYISVSTDELVRRLAGRWNCRGCGAVYHEQSKPPRASGICDNCGGELYQREDDNPDVVRTRIEVNLKETEPLLEYYRAAGKLAEVDGERDVEAVTEQLMAALGRPESVR
jgi:adenylate kinase